MAMKPAPLIVICGPSGVGKTTLLKQVMKLFKNIALRVSHTTRSPRIGEINGVDYYFVNKGEMLAAIENDEFIEHKEYGGYLYGTSKAAIEHIQREDKLCILVLDIEGVKRIKKHNLFAKYIFIMPPSMEALEHRLRVRNTENEDVIRRRLKHAIDEINYSKNTEHFDLVILNDKFDEALEHLKLFIMQHIDINRQSD